VLWSYFKIDSPLSYLSPFLNSIVTGSCTIEPQVLTLWSKVFVGDCMEDCVWYDLNVVQEGVEGWDSRRSVGMRIWRRRESQWRRKQELVRVIERRLGPVETPSRCDNVPQPNPRDISPAELGFLIWSSLFMQTRLQMQKLAVCPNSSRDRHEYIRLKFALFAIRIRLFLKYTYSYPYSYSPQIYVSVSVSVIRANIHTNISLSIKRVNCVIEAG
jgi:hypothetical protein